MADDVVRFLDSISFGDNRDEVKDVNIEKVLLHKKDETFEVVMTRSQVLPYEVATSLIQASKKGIHQKEKCFITLKYESVTEDDVVSYLEHM